MKKEMNPTPKHAPIKIESSFYISDESGKQTYCEPNDENAAHIVKCVNLFEDLLSWTELYLQYLDEEKPDHYEKTKANITETIRRAKGQE